MEPTTPTTPNPQAQQPTEDPQFQNATPQQTETQAFQGEPAQIVNEESVSMSGEPTAQMIANGYRSEVAAGSVISPSSEPETEPTMGDATVPSITQDPYTPDQTSGYTPQYQPKSPNITDENSPTSSSDDIAEAADIAINKPTDQAAQSEPQASVVQSSPKGKKGGMVVLLLVLLVAVAAVVTFYVTNK